MPGPFTHPGTFIPGEDSQEAGTLRRLQHLHEILRAVDELGGQDEPPPAMDAGPQEPGPETGPWNPKHPKFSAFMQKWGPLVQMGGAAVADIGNDAMQPRIDTGRVRNRQPSSMDQLRGDWAAEGKQREKDALHKEERRDTMHRESMLNRRAILPTILSALLKEDEEPKPDKKATGQALLEFTEQQEWFQKLDDAEKNRVRKGILRVKEEDDDMEPGERAYRSRRGSIEAEIDAEAGGFGGPWSRTKPDKDTEKLGDQFEQELYGKLLSKTQGPLEDPMTPEKARMLAQQARETYFGPKPQMPIPGSSGPGGAGAGAGNQNPGLVPPGPGDSPAGTAIGGDPNFPDIGLRDRLDSAGLSNFTARSPNYSPAPQQPLPTPTPGLPTGLGPAGPGQAPGQIPGQIPGQAPPGGMPPQAMSPENMRPMRALLDWDKLVQKLQADPQGPAKLAAYKQAFIAQHGFDPDGQ